MAVVAYSDSPAYSFGTMQPVRTYTASPGKNVTLVFYIFNAYGNRVTHVNLIVVENSANLEITLPPVQTKMWNISGIITPIEDSLYVEPMPIVDEKPTADPCYLGICYLKSTNVSGYIPAKKVMVQAKIPDNAQYGDQYRVEIDATANWYGEMGTSQVSQVRPFSYTLFIVAENYSESLYNPAAEEGQGFTISNEMLFGGVFVLLVLVIALQQFKLKKRK